MIAFGRASDDPFVLRANKSGPTLAKAKAPSLLQRREGFVRTIEGRWRELFADADSMSEGGVREEVDGKVWYGSTSLILTLPTGTPEDDRIMLRDVAGKDVHVHVHALRCAHREAQSRAPGMLGRTVCEFRVCDDPRGLRIDVDVQAPLIGRRQGERAQRSSR